MLQTVVAPAQILDWAKHALRGETFEYFRGELSVSRVKQMEARRMDVPVEPEMARDLDSASDAWTLYENGKVLLTQRRNGDFDFSYLAVKR